MAGPTQIPPIDIATIWSTLEGDFFCALDAQSDPNGRFMLYTPNNGAGYVLHSPEGSNQITHQMFRSPWLLSDPINPSQIARRSEQHMNQSAKFLQTTEHGPVLDLVTAGITTITPTDEGLTQMGYSWQDLIALAPETQAAILPEILDNLRIIKSAMRAWHWMPMPQSASGEKIAVFCNSVEPNQAEIVVERRGGAIERHVNILGKIVSGNVVCLISADGIFLCGEDELKVYGLENGRLEIDAVIDDCISEFSRMHTTTNPPFNASDISGDACRHITESGSQRGLKLLCDQYDNSTDQLSRALILEYLALNGHVDLAYDRAMVLFKNATKIDEIQTALRVFQLLKSHDVAQDVATILQTRSTQNDHIREGIYKTLQTLCSASAIDPLIEALLKERGHWAIDCLKALRNQPHKLAATAIKKKLATASLRQDEKLRLAAALLWVDDPEGFDHIDESNDQVGNLPWSIFEEEFTALDSSIFNNEKVIDGIRNTFKHHMLFQKKADAATLLAKADQSEFAEEIAKLATNFDPGHNNFRLQHAEALLQFKGPLTAPVIKTLSKGLENFLNVQRGNPSEYDDNWCATICACLAKFEKATSELPTHERVIISGFIYKIIASEFYSGTTKKTAVKALQIISHTKFVAFIDILTQRTQQFGISVTIAAIEACGELAKELRPSLRFRHILIVEFLEQFLRSTIPSNLGEFRAACFALAQTGDLDIFSFFITTALKDNIAWAIDHKTILAKAIVKAWENLPPQERDSLYLHKLIESHATIKPQIIKR